jgi:5-methylcytosine-specific restriction protein A
VKKSDLTLSTYPRSPEWDKVKRRFKKMHPTCEVCGSRKGLTVHHVIPVYLKPELELEESNLITLCKGGTTSVNCHLLIGHLKDYKSWNRNVKLDAKIWRERIKTRPKPWEVDKND